MHDAGEDRFVELAVGREYLVAIPVGDADGNEWEYAVIRIENDGVEIGPKAFGRSWGRTLDDVYLYVPIEELSPGEP